jgi:hypothetical protein
MLAGVGKSFLVCPLGMTAAPSRYLNVAAGARAEAASIHCLRFATAGVLRV